MDRNPGYDFLNFFEDWISQNTRGVLIIQIRDRPTGGWDYPYVTENIGDHATKPFLMLQHNWFKTMEYFQNDLLSYYSQHAKHRINKIIFQYATEKQEDKAALNFHLTQREKKNIMSSPDFLFNIRSFKKVDSLFQQKDSLLTTSVE